MALIDNKKVVTDLFHAYYGDKSPISYDNKRFSIPLAGYQPNVSELIEKTYGTATNGLVTVTLKQSGLMDILFDEQTLKYSHKLTKAYFAGKDISDTTRLGIDSEYIYAADQIVRLRQSYGLPIESEVLLARLLIKYEYSTINKRANSDVYKLAQSFNPIVSYKSTPYEVIIRGVNKRLLDAITVSTESYTLPSGFIKDAISDLLMADIRGIVTKNPMLMNDKGLKEILEPVVYGNVVLSKKVREDLWMIREKYAVEHSKYLQKQRESLVMV